MSVLIRLFLTVLPSILSSAKVQEFIAALLKAIQARAAAGENPHAVAQTMASDPMFVRGTFRDLLKRLFDRNPAPIPVNPSDPDGPVIIPTPPGGSSWMTILFAIIAGIATTFGYQKGCGPAPQPNPPPAPGPVVPPQPPQPTPPPAPPMDAETKRIAGVLHEAYGRDTGEAAAKSEVKVWLKNVYQAAAAYPTMREKPDVADSPYVILGVTDLVGRVRQAASSGMKPDDLKGTRSAIAKEVGAVLPFDGPLSDEQRAAAKTIFARISTALGSF